MKFSSPERRKMAVDEGRKAQRIAEEQKEQKERETERRHERKPLKTPSLPAKYERGFLNRLDQRTEIARELRAAFDEIVSDQGGIDTLSHVKRVLCEKFCWLSAILRGIELQIADKDKTQQADLLAKWIQGLNSLTGLARTIGIERRARKAERLEGYLKDRGRRDDR